MTQPQKKSNTNTQSNEKHMANYQDKGKMSSSPSSGVFEIVEQVLRGRGRPPAPLSVKTVLASCFQKCHEHALTADVEMGVFYLYSENRDVPLSVVYASPTTPNELPNVKTPGPILGTEEELFLIHTHQLSLMPAEWRYIPPSSLDIWSMMMESAAKFYKGW
jgi:hypothetical protein